MAAKKKLNINNQPKNIRLAYQNLVDAEIWLEDLKEDVDIGQDEIQDILDKVIDAKNLLTEKE